MKNRLAFGAVLASTIALAACGQSGSSGNSSGNSGAATPAANSSSAAPASGNSAAPAAGGQSADATNQNFTIRNNTGQTINELYVSAVSVNNWEEDILGRDVLPNGESAQITFERSETECNWDMRVVFENGQSLEERGVNLCQTAEIEIAP